MRPRPLPPELTTRAFTVDEASHAGVPAKRLRAQDLTTPFPGVRAGNDLPSASVLDRCRLLLPRLEAHQFFSHVTAAALYDAPLPGRWASGDLHVGALHPRREPRIAGVVGHRLALRHDDLTLVAGLPVPGAAETFAQLGGLLSFRDLVGVADHLLRIGAVESGELLAAANVAHRRGAVLLREAAAAARAGSESVRETHTRLALIDAGLPEPELNWTLRTDSGRFVARLDLAYPRYRVAVEYDGRQHAEPAQFARDADRWNAIADEGWLLIRVLAHHMQEPRRLLIPRVLAALRSRGWPEC